ncbi:SMR family transporter [Duganella callida]|uniref:Multidrug transporter n=1 Tax=Duganella callida TaxID=2561932 RepID=A0A4Y9SD93_9BURK|nr:SMR family transporter [Duganella callida]TFW17783.1 hypothetical protein E4L98_19800 [Duganella callida]
MNPTFAGFLWCALASVASAAATYLIKLSSVYGGNGINLTRLMWLGGAVTTYVLGFVCYSVALQKLQISLAYPVMTAITMALVALAGSVLLQEAMTPTKIAGMLLIASGAFVMAR